MRFASVWIRRKLTKTLITVGSLLIFITCTKLMIVFYIFFTAAQFTDTGGGCEYNNKKYNVCTLSCPNFMQHREVEHVLLCIDLQKKVILARVSLCIRFIVVTMFTLSLVHTFYCCDNVHTVTNLSLVHHSITTTSTDPLKDFQFILLTSLCSPSTRETFLQDFLCNLEEEKFSLP